MFFLTFGFGSLAGEYGGYQEYSTVKQFVLCKSAEFTSLPTD